MQIRSVQRNIAGPLVPIAVLMLLALGNAAYAEGCLIAPAKLSDAEMQAFKRRPAELLDRYPAGGPAMSGEIVRRAGSDVAAVAGIVALAQTASTAQRVAIGVGLAKTARICSRTHPQLEQRIRQAVAEAGISELAAAFAAGSSPLEQTAATLTGDERAVAAPLGGKGSAGGGSAQPPASGAGGLAAIVVGTELVTFSVEGSTIWVRRSGGPARSLRLGDTAAGAEPDPRQKGGPATPPFSSRATKSTYGNTVSPTTP